MRSVFSKNSLNKIFTGKSYFSPASNNFVLPTNKIVNSLNLEQTKGDYDIVDIIESNKIFILFANYKNNNNGFICLLDSNWNQLEFNLKTNVDVVDVVKIINKWEALIDTQTSFIEFKRFKQITKIEGGRFIIVFEDNSSPILFNNFTNNWLDLVSVYNLNPLTNTYNQPYQVEFTPYNNGSVQNSIRRTLFTCEKFIFKFFENKIAFLGINKPNVQTSSDWINAHPEHREILYVEFDEDFKISQTLSFNKILEKWIVSIRFLDFEKINDEIYLFVSNKKSNRIYLTVDRSFNITSPFNLSNQLKITINNDSINSLSYSHSIPRTDNSVRNKFDSLQINGNRTPDSIENLKITRRGQNVIDSKMASLSTNNNTVSSYNFVLFDSKSSNPDYSVLNDIAYRSFRIEHSGNTQTVAILANVPSASVSRREYTSYTLSSGVITQRTFTFSTFTINDEYDVIFIEKYDWTPVEAINLIKLTKDNRIDLLKRSERHKYVNNAFFRKNSYVFGAVGEDENPNRNEAFLWVYMNINDLKIKQMYSVSTSVNYCYINSLQMINKEFFIGYYTTTNSSDLYIVFSYYNSPTNISFTIKNASINLDHILTCFKRENIITLMFTPISSNSALDSFKSYIVYDGGLSTSTPYFFQPYSNEAKNHIPERLQFLNNTNDLCADITIQNIARNKNSIIATLNIDREILNRQSITNINVIGRTNNVIHNLNTNIRKDFFNSVNYTWNLEIKYSSINLKNNNKIYNQTISEEIAKLYYQKTTDNINDIIRALKIDRIIFYSNNNTIITKNIEERWISIVNDEIVYNAYFAFPSFAKNNETLKRVEVTNALNSYKPLIFFYEDLINFNVVENIFHLSFKISYT